MLCAPFVLVSSRVTWSCSKEGEETSKSKLKEQKKVKQIFLAPKKFSRRKKPGCRVPRPLFRSPRGHSRVLLRHVRRHAASHGPPDARGARTDAAAGRQAHDGAAGRRSGLRRRSARSAEAHGPSWRTPRPHGPPAAHGPSQDGPRRSPRRPRTAHDEAHGPASVRHGSPGASPGRRSPHAERRYERPSGDGWRSPARSASRSKRVRSRPAAAAPGAHSAAASPTAAASSCHGRPPPGLQARPPDAPGPARSTDASSVAAGPPGDVATAAAVRSRAS